MNTQQDIALIQLFKSIWHGKWFVLIMVVAFSIISVFYALSLPNKYKSDVLLAPASHDQQARVSGLGQLGGLASMAGINIGAEADKTAMALEVLQSRRFITDFIQKYELLVPLLAVKSWDWQTNTLKYDQRIYDSENDVWVRKVNAPLQAKPSLQEAHEAFLEILSFEKARDSGMLRLSIIHPSPEIAQQWVSLLVQELNAFMQREDIEEAKRSMSFLEKHVKDVQVEELRRAAFQLIEEQTKRLMLANIRDEYVFKVIDPAVVSQKRHSPRRSLICIAGALLGGVVSIFLLLLHFVFRQLKHSV